MSVNGNTLKRRAVPDQLRHLAGKLREGEEGREAVALALDVLADEIEPEPGPIRDASGVRICFCDLGGKPYGEPESHDAGCLMPGFLTAWKAAAERNSSWVPFRNRLKERDS